MTPHLEAAPGDVAKIVLMPGDPLRAKFIAERFLENAEQYNAIRGMYGYTGVYKGTKVSVQGSGMGIPSIGIYSYEIFNFYQADIIIRVGTAGALHEDLDVGDIVFAAGACTNSNFASQYSLPGSYAPIADFTLLSAAARIADEKNCKYRAGNVITSDTFYNADTTAARRWADMGVLAIEMECAALYMNAAHLKKRALGILTISDHIFTGKAASPEERQTAFTGMMTLALETAVYATTAIS